MCLCGCVWCSSGCAGVVRCCVGAVLVLCSGGQGSVLVKNGPGSRLFVKGAVEQILSRTRFWLSPSGKAEAMDADTRAKFTRYIDAMTRTGLRCIGIAYQVTTR